MSAIDVNTIKLNVKNSKAKKKPQWQWPSQLTWACRPLALMLIWTLGVKLGVMPEATTRDEVLKQLKGLLGFNTDRDGTKGRKPLTEFEIKLAMLWSLHARNYLSAAMDVSSLIPM